MTKVGDGTGPESIVVLSECIPSEYGAVETGAFAEGAPLTIAEVVDSQVLGLKEPLAEDAPEPRACSATPTVRMAVFANCRGDFTESK
jgi:hypothetical protein